MSDTVPSNPIEQIGGPEKVSQTIEQVTVQFSISQMVASLADILDWLLDESLPEERWLEERQSFQYLFAQRWRAVSERSIRSDAREVSSQALKSGDYDPFSGAQSWGTELTRVFRAALAELGTVTGEALHVFPDTERMRAFARAMSIQSSSFILPVLSFAPLLDSEWQAILSKLDELVQLALTFEGAISAWLIGGFYRDVNGRLTLHPQLSLTIPHSGTRVKPVHIILGTAYEEQCPSLHSVAQTTRGAGARRSDALIAQTPWHRVVVQVDVSAEDYELLNLSRLSDDERELARQIMYLDQQPRGQQILEGPVDEVPRPWSHWEATQVQGEPAPAALALDTQELPPRVAVEAASQFPVGTNGAAVPTADSLRQDAEDLRRKGMAVVTSDPGLALKYLLASTVLENTSVDVWLTLADLASTPKQKETFRREAEKALKRQHSDR